MRFASALVSALFLLSAAPAWAVAVVINNGLAPPNPGNVIDAADDFRFDRVFVQNVGCDAPLVDCPMPWGVPTSVELAAGGSVGVKFEVFQTSTITISGGRVGEDGFIADLQAFDFSTVTMSGGSVDFDFNVFDSFYRHAERRPGRERFHRMGQHRRHDEWRLGGE